ncbi:MAG: tetratricopeptide repeat protein [Burkholderiales bacterium]
MAMPKGPSIAVLPFANLSGDPAQDYFSDGLTEQIISDLARFRGLYVIARNSTFKYKGRTPDVREVGRDLSARYILEGSVRRSGDTLRVTAQLLDGANGAHLWAETYERSLTGANIFALQDDITAKAVANIAGPHGRISQAGLEQTTRKTPKSIDSYDCVLRAYVWNRVLSREGHGPLRDCLEAAVARDPDYGEAWAWLAFSYLFEYEAGYNPRPERYNALDQALKAGQRAVELDPNNAGVHVNMSYVRFLRREFDASLASAERALLLNPNDPAVLCQAGHKMVYAGIQVDRGVALSRKAMALGPHYPPWCHYHLSYFHYRKGEYEQALAESLKIDLPELFWTHVWLAMDYGQLGRQQEAKAALTKLAKLYPDFGKNARRELRNYMITDSAIEHAIDGLRKAGLDIPAKEK